MKLSFSTRGWNDLTWEQCVETAIDMRFQGIEINNPQENEDLMKKGGPLHKYNIAATARMLQSNELTIPCFNTHCDFAKEEDTTDSFIELLKVAKAARVPYVTFLAFGDDEKKVYERVAKVLPEAEKIGITILVRTAGMYSDTARLRELMDSFASDYLAAMWDMHYPYRFNNEEPDTTIKNLGGYVKHVHLRDSLDEKTNCLVGEGDLPIEEMMRALSSIDYDGFISLDWKPVWMPELTDHEVIFPHFVNYMSRYEDTKGNRKHLYPNHDGTGEYVWKKFELVDMTFPQVLDRMCEEFPDQYAFKYTTLDYIRTYSEFREDVDNFARALMSMGVKAGSKVSIWATNVPAWFITFWATTKIGAVLVTVNTSYKIHEAEYLLRQSDTHTLVMIESMRGVVDYKGIINQLCPEIKDTKPGEPLHCKKLPFLRNVITVGFDMPGCLNFDQAMNRASLVPKEELARVAAKVKPNDVCNMQYTSGTTGFPKGVMLTHYNVVNDGKCIGDRMGLSTADRMMIQVPMFHCFGMTLSMTASMTHGTTMCPMPYFSAKASLACVDRERITCFNGVPTMFIAMFNHPDYRKTDFSHIRTGIMAGSGCPPELMRRAAQLDEMHMYGIVSVYGQTESAPGSTMSEWTDSEYVRTETVGYAFPHVQCKVVDPETGLEVPDGVNGEFCSRGYNIMKGYYKMPQATKDTVDEDGWLHSGDLVCRDSEGNFKVTGRLKDMIIRGGENIYPKEIEEFIYTNEKVQDVQVIGVPDKKYGEESLAAIILKEGETCTVEEMHDFIAASLAFHKIPKYIEFVDSFPMNAAGKILKYKMREEATKRLGLEDAAGIDTGKSAEEVQK